jgi:hypothetical protein
MSSPSKSRQWRSRGGGSPRLATDHRGTEERLASHLFKGTRSYLSTDGARIPMAILDDLESIGEGLHHWDKNKTPFGASPAVTTCPTGTAVTAADQSIGPAGPASTSGPARNDGIPAVTPQPRRPAIGSIAPIGVRSTIATIADNPPAIATGRPAIRGRNSAVSKQRAKARARGDTATSRTGSPLSTSPPRNSRCPVSRTPPPHTCPPGLKDNNPKSSR